MIGQKQLAEPNTDKAELFGRDDVCCCVGTLLNKSVNTPAAVPFRYELGL